MYSPDVYGTTVGNRSYKGLKYKSLCTYFCREEVLEIIKSHNWKDLEAAVVEARTVNRSIIASYS